MSHHVSCGALWRPITAARLCLLLSPLRWTDSGANCSATRPWVGCFADPATSAKSASSRPGHSLPFTRLGSVRWHAHVRCVTLSSATPYLVHPSQWRTNKCPPRRLHAWSLPLQRRCCALLGAHALPSLYHHDELSPPYLPRCAGLHCPHAMRGYKRRPPLRLVRTRAVSASGKPSPPHPPLFSTASSVPSHLTHLSPCTQAPELHQTLELLSNPKDEHLHRRWAPASLTALLSFAPLSPAFLAVSWGSQSCQASAPWAGEACSVHLAEIWLSGPSTPRRARDASGHGSRLAAGQAGSGPHCPGLFGAVAGPWQAERALCAWAELSFGPEDV
jgi:hypothetical protein